MKKSTRVQSSRYNYNLANSKRSQVTLFIILAIVLVAVLIIIFNVKIRDTIQNIVGPSSPEAKMQNCISTDLKEAITNISLQGGSFKPLNGMMYQGRKVDYLCYTNEYYTTCVNQQPMLKEHIERELLASLKPKIDNCLAGVKADLQDKGYTVSSGKEITSINLIPESIKVTISGLNIASGSENRRYSKFEIDYKSNLYNIVMITNSILNWEAHYGDADTTTYMLYYPNIKVEKLKQSDGSKIYILTSENDKFVFATRSLSWPAGYGFGETFKPTA